MNQDLDTMKSKPLFRNKISVKKSRTHGYGVFADKDIRKGEMIEECYFIVTDGGDDVLDDYYFEATDEETFAVLTGYGVIYNHDPKPNADYNFDFRRKICTFTADEPIKKGEEIFITYGEEWFESRDKKAKTRKKKTKKKK